MIFREFPLINFFNQKSPTKNFKFRETPSTSTAINSHYGGWIATICLFSAIIFNQSRNFQLFVVIKASLLTTNLHQTDINSAAYAKPFRRTRWLEFKGSIVWSANRKRKQAELITSDAKCFSFSVIKNSCLRTPEIMNCGLFHSLFNTAHGTNPIPRDPMMHCINDNLLIKRRKLFATVGAEKAGLKSSALMKHSKQNSTWTNHLMEFSFHSCRRHEKNICRGRPAKSFSFENFQNQSENKSHVASREHTASIIFPNLDYLPIKTFP